VNIWRVGPVLLFHYVLFLMPWGLVFLLLCVHVVLHVMMTCGLVDGHQ